jgi:hypothetical protein
MIGIPVNRSLSPKFSISLQKLTHYLIINSWTVDINYNNGSVLSTQRNQILKQALKENMNLLFVDSDMIFDADVFVKVFEQSKEKTLVGGMCFMRRFPFQPAVFSDDLVDDECVFKGMKLKDMPIYPFHCAAVGCAFLYIRHDDIEYILDNYEYPFNHYDMKNGECLGEDLSFFYRCNKLGLKTVCVPSVEIGHLTDRIITRKDHMAALGAINENK